MLHNSSCNWSKSWEEYIPDAYVKRPHTRLSNKIRLKYKLIMNPKLKDLVINVEDTPVADVKTKKTKGKNQKKQKQEVSKKQSTFQTRIAHAQEVKSQRNQRIKEAKKSSLNILVEAVAAMP
jgi:hypothetical protein